MEVTVRDRSVESPWGHGPTSPATRVITIADHCPVPGCGAKRGEPQGLNSTDDGAHYWVQTWKNPCGHRDDYVDVLKEAKALAEADGTCLRPAVYH